MNNNCIEDSTWWSTLQKYLNMSPPWVLKIIQNMHLALDLDKKLSKSRNNMQRVSTNNMNHIESKFDQAENREFDWRSNPNDVVELLWLLQFDMMLGGLNFSMPKHKKGQLFVSNAMETLSWRFDDHQGTNVQPSTW